MSTGRTTGLPYDNWTSQHPDWLVDNIRHEPPLLRHEAIVCAMQEKVLARSFTAAQGGPVDDGFSYLDIATHGYLNDAGLYDQVAEQNIDNLFFWANFNDNGGVWHGVEECAPAWTEVSMSLDINPSGHGTLQRPNAGDLYTAEYIREQYDILNRQIWYLEALSNFSGSAPSLFNGLSGIPLLGWTTGEGSFSANKWLHVGNRWEGYLSDNFLGEVSTIFPVNTIDAVTNDATSLTTNDSGSFFVNKSDVLDVSRVVFNFGFSKVFDAYVFTTKPRMLHNAATTDDFDSALNGNFDTLTPFIDHSGFGVLENRWVYASDGPFTVATGAGANGTGEGGWQVRTFTQADILDIVHNPVEEFVTDPANSAFPGIMVVRMDIVGGMQFVDPAINPSGTISLPSPVFP